MGKSLERQKTQTGETMAIVSVSCDTVVLQV